MTMRTFYLLVLVSMVPFLAPSAYGQTSLGSALDPFAVLAGTSVTNAGAGVLGETVITGSLGVSTGTSCTGFVMAPVPCTLGPGTVVDGTYNVGNGQAAAAQGNLTTAFNTLSGLTPTGSFAAGTLSGQSVGPGVYTVTSAAIDLMANSTLTLNAPGRFVFVMVGGVGSTLIAGDNVTVDISALDATSSVYWVAASTGTAVSLGKNDDFQGNLVTNGAITFDTGATVGCGRALSQTGLVSFAGQDPTSKEQNLVGGGCTGSLANSNGLTGSVVTPEPGTFGLFGAGLGLLLISIFRRSKLSALRAA
jgi:hypothetical protein